VVFLNTLEYWTGENPLAYLEDSITTQMVETPDHTYRVTSGEGRILIEELNGDDILNSAEFHCDPIAGNWTMEHDGRTTTIAEILPGDPERVRIYSPDGLWQDVTLEN